MILTGRGFYFTVAERGYTSVTVSILLIIVGLQAGEQLFDSLREYVMWTSSYSQCLPVNLTFAARKSTSPSPRTQTSYLPDRFILAGRKQAGAQSKAGPLKIVLAALALSPIAMSAPKASGREAPTYPTAISQSAKAFVCPASGVEKLPAVVQAVQYSIPYIQVKFVNNRNFNFPVGQTKDSFGSGIAIDKTHIVTNSHVLDTDVSGFSREPVSISIAGPGGTRATASAKVIVQDEKLDLAILEITGATNGFKMEPAVFRSSDPPQGLPIAAFGNPKGVKNIVTFGVVGGVNIDLEKDWTELPGVIKEANQKGEPEKPKNKVLPAYQVPMLAPITPISPGNSGGAVVDMCGNIIGMPTFFLKEAQNLNFAYPSKVILDFLKRNGLKPQERAVEDTALAGR